MSRHHHARRARPAHADAPVGTCIHCGDPCGPRLRQHPACRDKARRDRNYRAAARDQEGAWQRCVSCRLVHGQTRPDGSTVRMQRDHIHELQDNGPWDWTQALCTECHKTKTNAARAARTRGRRPVTKQQTRGKQQQKKKGGGIDFEDTDTLVVIGAVAVVVFLGGLAAWRRVTAWWATTDVDVAAYARLALLAALALATLTAWAAYARWRARGRARARERLADLVGRAMHTSPADTRVRVRRWRGTRIVAARVQYGPMGDDADGSPARADVEDAVTTKVVGGPTRFTWQPDRDRVTFTPDPDPTSPMVPVPAEEAPAPVRANVEAAVRSVIRGTVTFAWAPDDDQGPTRVTITYPPEFPDDSDDKRAEVAAKIATKAPTCRWRAEWDTGANRVNLIRRPAMPGKVPATIPTRVRGGLTRVPLGIGEDGSVIYWDIAVGPHALCAGTTGGGKSVTIAKIIWHWLGSGGQAVIVDGKGTTLAGFRDVPGVIYTGMGDPEAMAEAMQWAEGEMLRRYARVLNDDADPADFIPLLVVLDEAAQFATTVKRWWDGLPKKIENEDGVEVPRPRNAPAIDAWASIARLGREGRVHLVVGIQQAAAAFFGGTESREQLPVRIGMGPMKPEGAAMMFGRRDVGRDVPPEAKGRATVEVDSRGPVEVQMHWCPEMTPSGRSRVGNGPDGAALLDDLRAAAQAAHLGRALPRVADDDTTDLPAVPPIDVPPWDTDDAPAPGGEAAVRVGDLVDDPDVEGMAVLIDIDGTPTPVALWSVEAPEDDGGDWEVTYRHADGRVGSLLCDADEFLELGA